VQEAGVLQRISDAARASRSELALIVLLALAVVGAGLVVIVRSSDPPAPAVERVAATPAAEASPSPSGRVVVHVSGQVTTPGVYELPEGSRVQDALEAAGGPLAEADPNALNLAAVLADGQKVTIPKPGEVLADDGTGTAQGAGVPGARVNLNLATQAQLEELPGVGPVLAQRIITHRQTKGRFTSPRQLLEVSGFGPKKYESVKDQITV
jgi:competence protein ComEA